MRDMEDLRKNSVGLTKKMEILPTGLVVGKILQEERSVNLKA